MRERDDGLDAHDGKQVAPRRGLNALWQSLRSARTPLQPATAFILLPSVMRSVNAKMLQMCTAGANSSSSTVKVLLDICQGKARSEQSGRYFVQARPHLTSDYRRSSNILSVGFWSS